MREKELEDKKKERETLKAQQDQYIQELETMRQEQGEQVTMVQQQMLQLIQQQQQFALLQQYDGIHSTTGTTITSSIQHVT